MASDESTCHARACAAEFKSTCAADRIQSFPVGDCIQSWHGLGSVRSAHLESPRAERFVPASLDEEHWLRHGVVGHAGGPAECAEAEQAAPVPIMALHGSDVAVNDILQGRNQSFRVYADMLGTRSEVT